MKTNTSVRRAPWMYIAIFALVASGIGVVGGFYYADEKEAIKHEKSNELISLADLKVQQIANWRKERYADALTIFQNRLAVNAVYQWLRNPTASSQKGEILSWLQSYAKRHQYENAYLIDEKGRTRLTAYASAVETGDLGGYAVREALKAKEIVFGDFQRETQNPCIRLDILIPLLNIQGIDTLSVGVVLLQIDPAQFFFPALNSSPIPSRTGEVLLVRREGDSILYLNETKDGKHPPLTFHRPMSQSQLPAARSLRGEEGVVEGVDYAGIPVMAAIRRIPDSPWSIVAKISLEELYGPVRERMSVIAIVGGLSILITALILAMLWRHELSVYYRRRYELEVERKALIEHYDYATKYANDIIFMVDQEERIVEFNERAVLKYGYTRDELRNMNITDIRDVDSISGNRETMSKVGEENGILFETTHRCKDGRTFPVEVSARAIRIGEDLFYQSIVRDITERKMAEEALAGSEVRYRRLFEAARDGILILDAETGAIIDVNPFLINLLGYSREQLLGKKLWELGLFKDILANKAGFLELQLKEYVRYDILPLETFDGQKIEVEFVSNVYEANQRKVIQCNIRDITKRNQADEAVRESEERFRMVFENVFDGICIYSEDLDPSKRRLIECNERYASMAGRTREELLQLGSTQSLQLTIDETANDNRLEFLAAGRAYRGSFSWIRPDGKENIVEYVGVPIKWRGKSHSIGIDRDITERKRAEDALNYERNLLKALMDNMPDHIYFKDKESRFLRISRSQASIFGIDDPAQAIGKTDFDFFAEEHARLAFEDEQKIMKSGIAIVDLEEQESWPDGRKTWVSTTKVPLKDAQGEIIGTFGVSRDITERKRADEALNESEQRFRRLFAASPDALMLFDPFDTTVNWPIVDCNEVACQMNGYMREELMGTSIDIFNVSKGTRQERAAYLERIRHEGVLHLESFHRHRDGHVFPIEISTSIINFKEHELVLGIDRDITERKQAAAEIKRRKEFLEAIMESSLDVIFTVTNEGILAFANSRITSVLGYAFEEVKGRHFMDFIPEEYRAELSERWGKRLQGAGGTYELQVFRKDGTRADCLISYSSIQGFDEYLVVVKDITTRKTAEKQNRTLAQAIRSIAECICITDLDDKILFANEAFLKTYGYEERELLGKSIAIVRSGKNKTETLDDILSATIEGSWQGELLNRRKDGSEFPVSLNTSIVTNEEGKAIALIGVAVDITERKRTEEERQRLTTAFQQTAEAILVTDPQGIIQYVNPAFERITGYKRTEVIGQNPRILKSGRQNVEYYRGLWNTISAGGKWSGRFINKRKDGTLFTEETSISAVLNEKGEITNYVGVKRDITSEISLQSQLTQAQKLESIGTLASGIAHDFNNILGIILGYVSLIERDPQTQAQSIQTITDAVKRGASLVKQILTFARKTDVKFGPFEVNVLVKEVVKMLKETFPKTIEISLQLDNSIPLIKADATQIHQAILNLCVNARDSMPVGGILALATDIVDGASLRNVFPNVSAEKYVHLSVADTGSGMDEKTRSSVFDPFFTTKEKGTGLGLSVVYGVMREHHGYVNVESEPGEGSTFNLYFPLLLENASLAGEKSHHHENIRGGHETVLIVEDEETYLDMMKLTLEASGYRVMTATDGLQALEVYRSHQDEIKLVMTDLGLPRLSGEQLYWEMKKLNPSVKVILASGYIEANAKSEILKAGVKQFIQKPYSPDDVLRQIRDVLDEK